MTTRPRKIHYRRYTSTMLGGHYTRCGKIVPYRYVTSNRWRVTCKICRRAIGQPVKEDPQ